MKITLNTFEECMARYAAGQSIGEIAEWAGISRQSLWQRFKRAGVELRPQLRYGQENHFYRGGGRKVTTRGYVKVYVQGRWRFEHRVVMERVLERPLLSTEDVHHKNHDRADNRPENLEVKARFDHLSDHKQGYMPTSNARQKQREKLLGRWMHRPDVSIEDAVALRARGLSINEIAKRLGCSWHVVKSRLREANRERSGAEPFPWDRAP